jgi:hypothetical protein
MFPLMSYWSMHREILRLLLNGQGTMTTMHGARLASAAPTRAAA